MKKLIAVVVVIVIAVGGYLYSALPNMAPAPVDVVRNIDTLSARSIDAGDVVGFAEGGSYGWLGIPFAAAPVGDLRWRSPQPPAPWPGQLQALQAPEVCAQIGGQLGSVPQELYGKPIGGEDCLYLNVWSPKFDAAAASKAGLPVMYWIHGGGNSIGHGAGYNGANLASSQNVVVVTINYRLGPLGWFSHPGLISEENSAADNSGNYGTLDAIAGLQWVQRNIRQFGGDPENVTVFGESAGGADTYAMVMSPLAKGLFHKAIVQSGGLNLTPLASAQNYTDEVQAGHRLSSKEIVNKLLVKQGKAKDRDSAKVLQQSMSAQQIQELLYSVSAEQILALFDNTVGGMIGSPDLFADGVVLPKGSIAQIFASTENYNAVPIITGSNLDESKLFMVTNPDLVERHFGIFLRAKDPSRYDTTARYNTDAWRSGAVDEAATLLRATQGASVFAYRFDWNDSPNSIIADLPQLLGAAHGLEIPFVFNDFASSFLPMLFSDDNLPGRIALANAMSSYWANFAYTGAPGKGRQGDLPSWSPWDNNPGSEKYLVLDNPLAEGIRMSSEALMRDDIKSRLAADKNFGRVEKCQMYVRLFGFDRDNWNQQEYQQFDQGCADVEPQFGFL